MIPKHFLTIKRKTKDENDRQIFRESLYYHQPKKNKVEEVMSYVYPNGVVSISLKQKNVIHSIDSIIDSMSINIDKEQVTFKDLNYIKQITEEYIGIQN